MQLLANRIKESYLKEQEKKQSFLQNVGTKAIDGGMSSLGVFHEFKFNSGEYAINKNYLHNDPQLSY